MKTNVDLYTSEEVKKKVVDYILLKRLLSYLKPYRSWIIFSLLLLIIAKGIEAWIPLQLGRYVQVVLDSYQSSNDQNFEIIIYGCLLLIALTIFNYGLDTLNIIIKNKIGQKAILKIRTDVYHHILHLPISYYDQSTIGRLITRTIHDIEQINQLFTESIIPLLGSLILFMGIFIFLFIMNWVVGILFCFIFPLTWMLVQHFRIKQRESYNSIRTIVAAMNTFIQEHLMGVNVVRSFGLDSIEGKKFNEINHDHYQVNVDTIKHFAFFFSGLEFLQNLTLTLLFLVLVYFSPAGMGFQAGAFFTVSLYCLMIFRPMFDLAERYNVLQSAIAAAERVCELLDEPIEAQGPIPGLPLDDIQIIEFEEVWFAYKNEEWILKGVSFKMKKGESVALVGVTGSGKTSIMSLLLRFYDYQRGRILINGHELKTYSKESLREYFGIILQDPVIFSATIRDNIGLYNPSINDEQIQSAIDYVRLTDLVNSYPEGLDYHLTERGTSLSVGEMQLIAMARAVVQKRHVLIFDEATANIDIKTEKLIQETLKKLFVNKTALIIAHRLSTIKDVHRILVLHQGIIVESGTHDELLEREGLYHKLVHLQSI